MDSTHSALIFFFGMFWASVLSAVAPFQVFDTRLLFKSGSRCRAVHRLFAGIVIVNVLPVLLLCALLKSSLMNAKDVHGIAVSAIASMSVFCIHRFLHAIVATHRTSSFFYSRDEAAKLAERGKTIDAFCEHMLPGLGYVFVPLVTAWLVCLF